MLNSAIQSSMVSICIALRSPEHALQQLEDVLFAAWHTSCRSFLLISLNVVDFCTVLMKSCDVTEGFGMVLLTLLGLFL